MKKQPPEMHPFDPKSERRHWIPAAYGQTVWPTFPSAAVGNGRNRAVMSFLYRFYDKDRQPLYIGVTTKPTNRWGAHVNTEWWSLARFVSLEAVDPARRLALEQQAIKTERPRFNRTNYTSGRALIEFNRGAAHIVEQLARRMSPEAFADLVETFRATDIGD